jgi:hypothetical protein
VCSLKLAEIREVALATGDPFQSDKIAERADRCLDAVDSSHVSAFHQFGEAERSCPLGK